MSPVFRDGEVEIYVADIEHPRSASLTVYRDCFGWLTIADGEGAETTVFLDLNDEADRQFAEQLHMVAGVLAVTMAKDEGEEDSGDEPA